MSIYWECRRLLSERFTFKRLCLYPLSFLKHNIVFSVFNSKTGWRRRKNKSCVGKFSTVPLVKLQVICRKQTKESLKRLHHCFYGCLFDATCLACSQSTKCVCVIYNCSWLQLHYTVFFYINELTSILLDWAFLEGWLSLLLKEDDPTFGLVCCWKKDKKLQVTQNRENWMLFTVWLSQNNQARVVRKVDKLVHWINHYSANSKVCFVNSYPLDGDLSGG